MEKPPPYPALITHRRMITKGTIPLLILLVKMMIPVNIMDKRKISLKIEFLSLSLSAHAEKKSLPPALKTAVTELTTAMN